RPYTTATINQTGTLPFQWTDVEKALDMERGEDRVERLYIRPAVAQARQQIESSSATFAYQNTNLLDGALGIVLPPAVVRAVKTSLQGDFNPQKDLSKVFRTGMVGVTDGFDWHESNSLVTHTAGTWASAVTMNSANQ